MTFWQESESSSQQFVDQESQLSEPQLLILSELQTNVSGECFLSWDDLIGQR